jgi:hypothetical protein
VISTFFIAYAMAGLWPMAEGPEGPHARESLVFHMRGPPLRAVLPLMAAYFLAVQDVLDTIQRSKQVPPLARASDTLDRRPLRPRVVHRLLSSK